MLHRLFQISTIIAIAAATALIPPAAADPHNPTLTDFPYDGMVRIDAAFPFPELWSRMEIAVRDHEMLLITRASASRAAANRGVDIPGNGVIDIYRNDFAVRMLTASVAAGYEAPMRFYLIETSEGSALIYRLPSAAFAPLWPRRPGCLGRRIGRTVPVNCRTGVRAALVFADG